jgi:glucose/arabinose dehydrogenase
MNAMLTTMLLAAIPAQLPPAHEREQAYWEIQYYQPPKGAVLEVGGLGFLPDGRLAVSTRRGQVWIVEDALTDDTSTARFQLLAEGLQEGLGLAVVGSEIYVVQRGELSRLGTGGTVGSSDGLGNPDVISTISNDWGLSGNYHEFAYGLPVDAQGNFYVSLNVGFLDPKWWHGKSLAQWRGWVVRIGPDGKTTPVACGFRSPCGIGINSKNEVFVTDNQGDWVASTPLYHVRDGAFYGHPASLDWTQEYRASQTKASDTVPPARERTPPAIWIPYKWSRSAGNMVEDATAGRFGPFGGDLFVAELTNGMVVRADLEKVQGEYQGACYLFRQRVGSATRVLFAPDGSLIVGFTNRGWGGYPPGQGLARIRWTGKTPMEIQHVHLLQDGFELTLTEPLADGLVLAPEQVSVQSYDYDYWWEYGSPERHTTTLPVGRVEVSSDRRRISLREIPLVAATCARVVLSGVFSASGQPLLHDEFSYTINQLPEGPRTSELVAKLVPPPPPRESGMEGWVRLTFGDALDAWNSSGWKLCDAEIDPADRHTLRTSEGDDALVNLGAGAPSPYVSKYSFGDAKVHVEFMLPEGGNSGVYLQGRYELQLLDSSGKKDLEYGDCGGIYRGEHWGGAAPLANGFREPGVWQDLDIVFEAPRFDASGKKVRNARFVRVLLDDVLLHENVEVPEPTLGSLFAEESAAGPLMLQGDHSPVAYREIRVFPLEHDDEKGWTALFDGESIDGWQADGTAKWEVVDGILQSSGERGHLFSPRDDYCDFDLRARVRISEGGNSGLYFRARSTGEWPEGYEAQINSNYPDPQKTGSLYGLSEVHVQLVPADTWFEYEVRCHDETDGTHITILVNGVVVTSYVDHERRHAAGHIALQQHNQGSVLQVERLEIREH